MLHLHHSYISCLYVPVYLVGDVCTQIVAILLVYVSILACCSALCILEKHMLALVDLIHALPTRGRKVHNSCFQGEFASRNEILREKIHLSKGACIHAFGFLVVLFCRWCRALLPHLEESAILEHFISVVSSHCP
jgi:hypothetical protein